LLKYTPPDHRDHGKLTQALATMKELNDFVNNNKRDSENIQKILAIQHSIYGQMAVSKLADRNTN
jgi:hypothetical protein